ncbi:MAG: hypothetical protein AB7F64_06320 [Gammaproteobacteria bacterium]
MIKDTDSQILEAGWQRVRDICFQYHAAHFKVIQLNKTSIYRYDEKQRGKVITIYPSDNTSFTMEDWYNVLQAINLSLADYLFTQAPMVLPGFETNKNPEYDRADEVIPGCLYVSYRAERSAEISLDTKTRWATLWQQTNFGDTSTIRYDRWPIEPSLGVGSMETTASASKSKRKGCDLF